MANILENGSANFNKHSFVFLCDTYNLNCVMILIEDSFMLTFALVTQLYR